MTVYDFIWLCTEDDSIDVEIWSEKAGDVVFTGNGREAKKSKYSFDIVNSYDAPTKPWSITINID